ncbi:MAG: hypothetical protein IPF99_36325 [Deltaproteobacteria bacterium]|nr:hypothetical protein [Deltaproteobacteria bacterium]
MSDELRARARWGAWRTAQRLRKGEPRWLDRLSGANEPGTIRVDLGWSFGKHSMEAAEEFTQRLREALGTDAGALAGRLFVVDDERWWALHGDKLVKAETAAGERRSVGAVVLAVGGHAGQTLDAVGEVLDARLPSTVLEVFRAVGAKQEGDDAKALGWACEALGAKPEDVVRICLDHDLLDRTAKATIGGWWEIVEAVAKRTNPGFAAKRPTVHLSKAVVKSAVDGQSTNGSTAQTPTTTTTTATTGYAKWIQGLTGEEPNDSALKVIYNEWPGPARDALLAARRWSNGKYRDDSKKDFQELAPLPDLTSKDRAVHGAPGVPVLDAVWAVRQMRGAYPGQLSAIEGATLRVTKVSLRVTASGGCEVVLFPRGDGDLRGFGRALAARLKPDQPAENVYAVVLALSVAGGADFEVSLPFAWRWKGSPSNSELRTNAWLADQTRFRKVAEMLDTITSTHTDRQSALRGARDAVERLQTCWAACAPGLDERRGLLSMEGQPKEVGDFLEAYKQAAGEMAGLFGRVGPLAARVADGPLEEFLGFGTGARGEARWLFGYHPLRLERQCAQERWALAEIERELSEDTSLQDIPVVSTPEVDGAPSVLWADPSSESYLVSTRDEGDPWCEGFRRLADPTDEPADLIEPLQPVFSMLTHLWPGMTRRLDVALDEASSVGDGFRLLALCADLAPGSNRPMTGGVDLHASLELAPVLVAERDEGQLAAVRLAMRSVRPDDPRRALVVHPLETSKSGELRHHIALLVRPSHRHIAWTTRSNHNLQESERAMAWDHDALAWSRPMVASSDSAALERTFQQLVVLRKRRDEDQLPRCFVQTLSAGTLGDTVDACARRAARAIVVDRVYGAEDLDAKARDGLQVTYADFDRKTGWRITVVGARSLDAETAALQRGLTARFPGGTDVQMKRLAERVTSATQRAAPAVLRALVRAGSDRPVALEGELIGHVAVALLMSATRGAVTLPGGAAWPTRWTHRAPPAPDGTLLLSMDSLQRWTRTRRSAIRGDFLALTPSGDKGVLITAIESKGSEGTDSAKDGTHQASVAREKLRQRFAATDRTRERAELLRCIAEEAFRAGGSPRLIYDRVAAPNCGFDFEAVSVETSATGSGLTVSSSSDDVLQLRVGGIAALLALAGLS